MNKTNFPFKTLIWAFLIIAVLFLFKPQVEKLLENSEAIEVLGVKIKVSTSESEELLKVQEKFEKESLAFNAKINQQDMAIDSLNDLAANLKDKTQGCAAADSITNQIDMKIKNLNTLNGTLKRQPLLTKDFKIIKNE
ncbi:MAG: hypothetical protein ABJN84_08885 [Flavobacteriaceae bacterium]